MTPQERDVLLPLLDRLRQTRVPVKDAEADQLIRQAVQAQPDAPYVLAQTVLVQDYALHAAEARVRELEQQLAQARQLLQQAQPDQHASGGGFLGGLFGGGRRAPAPAAPVPPAGYPQGYPQGYPPPAYGAPSYGSQIASAFPFGGGGSSFLRGAAQTAAGVAGGMLLADSLEGLFGHHGGGSGFMGDALGGNALGGNALGGSALGGLGSGPADGFVGGPESVDQFVEQAPGGYDAAPGPDDRAGFLGGSDDAYNDTGSDVGTDTGYASDAGDFGGDSFDDGGFADDGLNG